jgi:hypothetical protein
MNLTKLLIPALGAIFLSTAAMATTTFINHLPTSMSKSKLDLRLADTTAVFNYNCDARSDLKDNLMCIPDAYASDVEHLINIAGPFLRICDPQGEPATGSGDYCQHSRQLTGCQLDSTSLDGKTVTLSVDPAIANPTVADLQCKIS